MQNITKITDIKVQIPTVIELNAPFLVELC